MEDLHGIQNSNNPESNPTAVDLWLRILDVNLQNIKRGTVYEIAEAIDRKYVTSRSFRLMFLRANRYDPYVAATNVIKFLELKRTLFGQEKLTKKISLADLNEDDKRYLESGAVQISKYRDRSGRQILLFIPSAVMQDEVSVEALHRARYYVIMSSLESEENQRKGCIVVYFAALPTDATHHTTNSGVLWDLPIFFSSAHACFNEISAYMLMSVVVFRLPTKLRPRTRVHYGSCTDCLYKLSTFGIPKEAILTETDEPRLIDHLEWYRHRQEIEIPCVSDSETDSASLPWMEKIVPRSADVVFGTGSRKNGGNQMMRNLILAVLDEHQAAKKGRKVQPVDNVIETIKKRGGRFLKQNEETMEWEEVSHTEACRKIAHTFRNFRRPSRSKTKV